MPLMAKLLLSDSYVSAAILLRQAAVKITAET
jgi:hypothetical protein